FEESDSSDDYGLSVGSFDSREDEGEFDADDERDEVAEDKGAVAAAVHRPTTESLLDRSPCLLPQIFTETAAEQRIQGG
ncbi:hypothetical protein LTR66_008475, partial [Elasticomyces elasticus]